MEVGDPPRRPLKGTVEKRWFMEHDKCSFWGLFLRPSQKKSFKEICVVSIKNIFDWFTPLFNCFKFFVQLNIFAFFFIVFKGLPAESANLAKAEFLSHTKADEALAVVFSLVYKTQCDTDSISNVFVPLCCSHMFRTYSKGKCFNWVIKCPVKYHVSSCILKPSGLMDIKAVRLWCFISLLYIEPTNTAKTTLEKV